MLTSRPPEEQNNRLCDMGGRIERRRHHGGVRKERNAIPSLRSPVKPLNSWEARIPVVLSLAVKAANR